jgi:predicted lactoylglutathione lyase
VIGFYLKKKPAPGVEDISSVPIFFEKKKQTMHRQFSLDFSHCDGQKSMVYVLLIQKPVFQPVLTQNTYKTP